MWISCKAIPTSVILCKRVTNNELTGKAGDYTDLAHKEHVLLVSNSAVSWGVPAQMENCEYVLRRCT